MHRSRAAQATRAVSNIEVEAVYEAYANKFLNRIQKEASFLAAKPIGKLTAEEAANVRGRLIESGRYKQILEEVSLELQSALTGLANSKQAGKVLISGFDEKVTARLLLASERITAISAMNASNFKASWDKTVKTLYQAMAESPNSKKYAKILGDADIFKAHVSEAFKSAENAEDFVRKVLKFDNVAFQRGHEAVIGEAVVTGKRIPYVEGFSGRTFSFKLIEPGAEAVLLWDAKIIPLWESCISLKALPDAAARELGFSAKEMEKIAEKGISDSLGQFGGVDRLLDKIEPKSPKPAIPFAGSIERGMAGSKRPMIVPAEVLAKLREEALHPPKIAKGAAVALFLVSSVIAYSLMEEKKAEDAKLGGIPKKMK